MPKHPNGDVYAEHWPKIAVTLDYRGDISYWATTVELGGQVLPGEADAFAAVMKDAEAACDELNRKILDRGRVVEREQRNPIKAG